MRMKSRVQVLYNLFEELFTFGMHIPQTNAARKTACSVPKLNYIFHFIDTDMNHLPEANCRMFVPDDKVQLF